ncbi:phosphoribosylglycinamide formyltransferase [Paenibacillus contaminans]|uniref:Phosphoribosylglycinamide formyltransferase n=1 Tax=Paenibacillus contaminans TaxID=450362 RepID=A0A329LN83_9BACL|nr:phosphoribosylglycinamide formyltransferase [Paenibacillus contaminans]RAV08183.1 phosphoribosylglycinamide formyltransferase [Paenibacillus contaminans]
MEWLKIGFLASHGGSNMQAIVDACRNGKLYGEAKAVISNNSGSGAIERARKHGIPHYHLSSATHSDPESLDRAIYHALTDNGVTLIVLAGYMKKLGPLTLRHYKGRILNIHPSLLPKYGGHGMFGSKVHEAVLANRETVTGATIHLADEEYDTGAIVNQREVAVLPDDTAETLAARVLQCEHELFVETLVKISEGQIVL